MAIYHVIRAIVAAAALQTIAVGANATTAEEPVRPFRSVQKIFTQSCAFTTCHSAVSRKGNLILEHEDLSYAALVDKPSDHPDAKAAGLLRVVSGDPANSFLMRKLKAMGPGDAMPQNGGMLPDDVIKVIEDWIARGAHETLEECPSIGPDEEGGLGQHGGNAVTICDDKPIGGDYEWKPEAPLDPPARGRGVQLYVPPKPVESGTEWEACHAFRLKDLPNADALVSPFIKNQVYRMHAGSHHLLLYMYFGTKPDQFAEGWYPCIAGNCINDGDCPDDSGGLVQITIGGTQVAGTAYQVNYPEGVGLPILGDPNNVVFIANSHYTNPFQPAQDIYAEAWLNLNVHDPGEAKVILNGIFAINSGDLLVEPYQTRTINRVWYPRDFLTRQPTDAAIFQLFGHMHKRAREFDIKLVDAPCTGDCNNDNQCAVNEIVTGVNIAMGKAASSACVNFDRNFDSKVGIDELMAGVNVATRGCEREPEIEIYRTTAWDLAPIQDYSAPYLEVDRNEGLRWSCTHQNGRLLENGEEDPTYPAKKCHEGCAACGWQESTRTCRFTRDRSNRVYNEGEPMPLVFGLLADDDMCNMFGYFIDQDQVPLLNSLSENALREADVSVPTDGWLPGEAHDIEATWGNGTTGLFVDGVQVGGNTYSGVVNPGTPLYIGSDHRGSTYSGLNGTLSGFRVSR